MKCNNTLCKRHLENGECVKLVGEECKYEQAKKIIKELVRVEYADFTDGDYSNELSKVLERSRTIFRGDRKMTCIEITVEEWNELNYRGDTYFCNGCIFDEKTDNLIAFGWYEDELHEVSKYYKIVDKFIIPHTKAEQELNLDNNLADLGIF